MENKPETITLYYREGSSDKVYQASLEPSGSGFVVNFCFGRRGSTLNTGTKTSKPVAFAEAKKIYDKLVREKTAKGYTPGEDGTPYQHTDKSDRATGIVPQLMNTIDEAEVAKYIASADWWAQEKFDGRRVLIRRAGDKVIGINRLGLAIDPAKPLASYARTIGDGKWLLDCEAVGDTFYAFDLLEDAGADLRKESYQHRLATMLKVVGTDPAAPIRAVETATTPAAKQVMLARLKLANREGIVFKRHAARYTAGRPASGGDWVKFKFVAMASCIVVGVKGGKRSVALELLDGERRVGVGNVTIPPNTIIPAAGSIVEIRYLYAYSGGSLYQPVYVGSRSDLTHQDCRLDQLKYRAEADS
jgi:bifunctional non-homologous end joining protein LigD